MFLLLLPSSLPAQTISQRGFVDGTAFLFPMDVSNDPGRGVADLLLRDELFVKPVAWIQLAGGVEVRANSHDQVEDTWSLDWSDRGVRRPRASVRRLSATLSRGGVSVEAGKQFIRWGKTDIINPTDRFAPRDFLNVIDSELLAVTGVRGIAQVHDDTFEGVWLPHFTPSRVPLLDQRWTAVTVGAGPASIVDVGSAVPSGAEIGIRWSHVGEGFEYAALFFDGFNHLPNFDVRVNAPTGLFPASLVQVEVQRIYPAIRTYGADGAFSTRWLTLKGEAAYFTSPSADQYVLYVVQLERQTGEWVLVGGYAGEIVTKRRSTPTFAPDRGLARSIVGRASYTIGPTQSVAFEAAARQNARGVYTKGEYSHAYGQHWRATLTAIAIAGHQDDFLGQYRRNSHIAVSIRFSF